ncbi:MAG: hypothetical protein ACPGYL_11585, partial [Rhodospirillaceae bacterium]
NINAAVETCSALRKGVSGNALCPWSAAYGNIGPVESSSDSRRHVQRFLTGSPAPQAGLAGRQPEPPITLPSVQCWQMFSLSSPVLDLHGHNQRRKIQLK